MMNEERFKETAYYGKISYETFQKCECSACDRKDCIHREAYRRMPVIVGGLGLCPRLKE